MKNNTIVIYSPEDVRRIVYEDFYIKYNQHPEYSDSVLYTTDRSRQIITKLEMILYTNQLDVISDPEMGCNLELYLFDFFVNTNNIEKTIREQISRYIPELDGTYELGIRILYAETDENPSMQHIILIYFVIDEDLQLVFQV